VSAFGEAHDPFPYVIRLRVAAGDDAVAETHEIRTVAYSVSEALYQAAIQLSGVGFGEMAKFTIEHVGPDFDAYVVMRLKQKAEREAAKKAAQA
jgi:hypothetical protein